MAEVMTVAEGRVAKSRADAFEEAYRAVRHSELTPGLRLSFLVRNTADAELYRIITVWESQEAFEPMRSSTQIPRGIELSSETLSSLHVEESVKFL